MRTIISCAVVAMLAGVGASADDSEGLTGWQKTKLVAVYPLAIHQLPPTFFHEGSHWLTARLLGDRPHLYLLPGYRENVSGEKVLMLAGTKYRTDLSPVRHSLALIMPYVVRVMVVDRGVAWAYQRGHIRIDSFGDKYVQNTLLFDQLSPMEDALSRDGDFGQLAQHLHVPRFILASVVQAAYIVSYNRMMKARGHENSTWEFYIHFTF